MRAHELALCELSETHDVELFSVLAERATREELGRVLLAAAWYGYEAQLRALLRYADPEVIDGVHEIQDDRYRVRTTPLIAAAECAHPRCVHVLLEHNAAHDAVDGRGCRALRYAYRYWYVHSVCVDAAVRRREYQVVANVLQTHMRHVGASLDARDPDGWTTLVDCASLPGCSGVVEQLLVAGADPNASGAHGVRALMIAASTGDVQTCAVLLRYGADRQAQDAWGETAINYAWQQDRRDVVALLRNTHA